MGKKACEDGEGDFAGENMAVRAVFFAHLCEAGVDDGDVGRAAEEGDGTAFSDELVGALGKVGVNPALRGPARADVEGDDGTRLLAAGHRGSCCRFIQHLLPEACGFGFSFGRNLHFEAAVVDGRQAEGFLEHFEMDGDLVLCRELFRRVGHREVRITFRVEMAEAGLGVADALARAAEGGDSGAALVAMEVDDEVEMARAQAADEAPEGEEALVRAVLVDGKTFVDAGVLAHEVGEGLVRQERDARLRVVRAERAEGGRDQEEVTDVHRVDDEDGFIGHEDGPFVVAEIDSCSWLRG